MFKHKLRCRDSNEDVPIPIDQIIDLQLNIDIIPVPGIQDLCDVDGFLSPDLSAIYVEEFVYNYRPYRFRFTLAHEIGHFYIHKDSLSRIKIDQNDVINSWVGVLDQIDSRDHSKMEYQGYTFGGLVLVPPQYLKKEFQQHLDKVEPLIQEAKSAGLNRQAYLEYAIDQMATILSPIFDVSTDVLTRRIRFDGLDQLFT